MEKRSVTLPERRRAGRSGSEGGDSGGQTRWEEALVVETSGSSDPALAADMGCPGPAIGVFTAHGEVEVVLESSSQPFLLQSSMWTGCRPRAAVLPWESVPGLGTAGKDGTGDMAPLWSPLFKLTLQTSNLCSTSPSSRSSKFPGGHCPGLPRAAVRHSSELLKTPYFARFCDLFFFS